MSFRLEFLQIQYIYQSVSYCNSFRFNICINQFHIGIWLAYGQPPSDSIYLSISFILEFLQIQYIYQSVSYWNSFRFNIFINQFHIGIPSDSIYLSISFILEFGWPTASLLQIQYIYWNSF